MDIKQDFYFQTQEVLFSLHFKIRVEIHITLLGKFLKFS